METIVSRLLHFAESQPNAVAFVERGQRLTYRGLGRRVRATAAWLHRAGVRAGDTVAVSFDAPFTGSLRSLQFFYALAHLGATVLPLYPEVPVPRRSELSSLFGARWVVGRQSVPEGCSVIDPDACDWRACERDGIVSPRADAPTAPFLFHFSGGTTGLPKAVLFNHEQFVTNMVVGAVQIRATASDRLLSGRPWPTLPGLRYLLRIHCVGGTCVNAFLPETLRALDQLLAQTGTTILFVSPWQLRRLLATEPPTNRRAPGLRVLYTAGAFLAPEEIRAARDTITPNVFASYATSEAGLLTLIGPDDPVGPTGCVGTLIPGMEAQVVDDEYCPVPRGTVGLLGFRAPWIPSKYVHNDKATARGFRDGWYYPGDLGCIDAGGTIFLQGRADDVINFGGIKLSPADLEPVLLQHPAVADGAIVGAPHPMAGQVPVAFVVLRQPATCDELATFFTSRIDASRLPDAFIEVPRIFRSPDGKIQRDRLLAEYGGLFRPV